MKSLSFAIVFLSFSFFSQAQKEVALQDISKHVDDSVLVGGKVTGVRAVSNGKLLLINVGGMYPNHLLTIVLNEEIQKILEGPLKAEVQQIKVAGKVELYRDKPQIAIKHPSQIQSIITEKAGADAEKIQLR